MRESLFSRLFSVVSAIFSLAVFTALPALYRPPASEHVALDRALRRSFAPSLVLAATAARFRAFMRRARTHSHFFGNGYYDTDHSVMFTA